VHQVLHLLRVLVFLKQEFVRVLLVLFPFKEPYSSALLAVEV